jgi:cold shock CspA family protein
LIGTLKIWNPRGFGFLTQDKNGSADVFVHASQVEASGLQAPLSVGSWFEFDTRSNPNGNGKVEAFNLRRLDKNEVERESRMGRTAGEDGPRGVSGVGLESIGIESRNKNRAGTVRENIDSRAGPVWRS